MEKSIIQSSNRNAWGCLLVVGLVFAIAGGAVAYGVALPAVRDFFRSGSWQATPCVMLMSKVVVESGEHNDTYRVAVKYRYEFGGHEYIGDRYRLLKTSSSGRQAKQEVVNRLAPGVRATCYVNPASPSESVMDRTLGWDALLLLLPLVFLAVGGGIMYAALRVRRKGLPAKLGTPAQPGYGEMTRRAVFAGAGFSAAAPARDQPLQLCTKGSRGKRAIGFLAVAIFWNGIVSVFLYQAYFSGAPAVLFLRLFLIPFMLVGLGLIAAVVYSLLGMANPAPTLVLSRQMLRPGESVDVKWSFAGDAGRIQHLRVYLEGRETATYRRGTKTTTDHAVFATLPLVDTTRSTEIAAGHGVLRIPAQTMPSFHSPNNAVEWRLIVQGEIPNWPDVNDAFTVVVYPLTAEGVAHATEA